MDLRYVCNIALGHCNDFYGINDLFLGSDKTVVKEIQEIGQHTGRNIPIYKELPLAHFEAIIGKGDSTTIYRARKQLSDKSSIVYAQKESTLLNYFMNEVLALLLLNNEGVINIVEIGGRERKDKKNVNCFRMEYISNPQFLKEIDVNNELEVEKLLQQLRQVVRTVSYIHENGIIHRDLKPKNIMLHSGGSKIIDLELSKISRADQGIVTGTEKDFIVGTSPYIPPEQAEGASNKSTPASDNYSLAWIIYEALSRKSPIDFEGNTDSRIKLIMISNKHPEDIRGLNPVIKNKDFATVLRQMLSKIQSERPFQTAKDFLAFLEKLDPYKLTHDVPLNV